MNNALADKDPSTFYTVVRQTMVLIALAVPIFAFQEYWRGKISLEWRCSSFTTSRTHFPSRIAPTQMSSRSATAFARCGSHIAFLPLLISHCSYTVTLAGLPLRRCCDRAWLTNQLVDSYHKDNNFFTLCWASAVDNPDQRIAEGVNHHPPPAESALLAALLYWLILCVLSLSADLHLRH